MLESILIEIEKLSFSGEVSTIKTLNSLLNDIIYHLETENSVGENMLLPIQVCCWMLLEAHTKGSLDALDKTFQYVKTKSRRVCDTILQKKQSAA